MASGHLADVIKQDQSLESSPHPLHHSNNMKLNEDSVALLTRIKRLFPLLMPPKPRLRMIDKIAMHAAVVANERGDTTVSVDDILIGMYQSLPLKLVDTFCSRLKITSEKSAEYKQKAFDMDYVSVEAFLRDIQVHAQKCGAEVQEDKLRPVLDCYKNILEWNSIYIKTTTKDLYPKELFVRPGHSCRWFELADMAKNHGLAVLSDNPAYQAYRSVCSKVNPLGSMVDISVAGDIQKFYAYFAQKAQSIGKLKNCSHLPASIFKNSALLESWGFKRFSIFGVDFKNNSMNFYFYTDQTEFNRAKIETMLTSLGFPLPSEETLQQMEGAGLVYFTFTHTSDKIERICFTRVYEDDMTEVVNLAPAFKDYIETAPIKSAKRNLLLGFAFHKEGHFLKLEQDYKASLQWPNKMKYTGLYPKPLK